MTYLERKVPPKREERLRACIAHSGTVCGLAKRGKACLVDDGERGFTQGSICLLLPALAILNSLPDTVVLLHGAIGCGACSHSQTGTVRGGRTARDGSPADALWLSTALSEVDVISGGEDKLACAIEEADQRYHPNTIVVVSGCVPGLIGDDIDAAVSKAAETVSARLVPVHCEGFKTKIWATAYDAVYHGIGRHVLGDRPEAPERPAPLPKLSKTVNLMNVSSMGRVDELELIRLLSALGLTVNVFPVFAHPESFVTATRAELSVSTCPTHDDYFLEHLQEVHGVPFRLGHMPIGIANTRAWIRDVAAFFGLTAEAEMLIAQEEQELREALSEFTPLFAGKTAFISAGEMRSLATAQLLGELGFRLTGIRSYHHDKYAEAEYAKLAALTGEDFPLDIANAQPFEEANLLRRIKPDLFLGHTHGNATAATLGIPTHVIYHVGLAYVGYRGAYEVARRLHRTLRNTAYNRKLARHLTLPYTDAWYADDPFAYVNTRGQSL